MRRRHTGLDIFFEAPLSAYFDSLRNGMKATVHAEKAEYLLNVNEEEYVEHLLSSAYLEPLQIHFDDSYAAAREEAIPAGRFPGRGFEFSVQQGRSYPKQVFRYHIPYSGTEDLLRYSPNR